MSIFISVSYMLLNTLLGLMDEVGGGGVHYFNDAKAIVNPSNFSDIHGNFLFCFCSLCKNFLFCVHFIDGKYLSLMLKMLFFICVNCRKD